LIGNEKKFVFLFIFERRLAGGDRNFGKIPDKVEKVQKVTVILPVFQYGNRV